MSLKPTLIKNIFFWGWIQRQTSSKDPTTLAVSLSSSGFNSVQNCSGIYIHCHNVLVINRLFHHRSIVQCCCYSVSYLRYLHSFQIKTIRNFELSWVFKWKIPYKMFEDTWHKMKQFTNSIIWSWGCSSE